MKLTSKLTLAFLLVSLIAIGLAAAFVGFTTATGFNKYIVDQREAQFISIATEYYRENGNWRGVEVALRQQGLLPPPVKPGETPPDPQPFALADAKRVVIIPGGEYQQGEKVKEGTLAKGIGIEIGGLVVGTVLVTGQTPVRSAIEQKYIDSVYQSLLVAALGGAAMALLLGLFLARTLTHPLRNLTEATRRMAQGKLEQQVPVHSKDEIGELAQSFNQMSADLTRANQSRRQMTADIAHDLRNPLTVRLDYSEPTPTPTPEPPTPELPTPEPPTPEPPTPEPPTPETPTQEPPTFEPPTPADPPTPETPPSEPPTAEPPTATPTATPTA